VEDVARDNGLSPTDSLRQGGTLKLKVRREMLDERPSEERTAARKPAKRG
jgi:hypothetical protein